MNGRSPPRMEDVALALGVHRTTVSLALRRDPRIPHATQENVRAVAEQLGYRPNPLVAALMQQQRGRQTSRGVTTLAYLTYDNVTEEWRRNPAYVEIFDGALTRAGSLGYRLEEFSLTQGGMSPRRVQQILRTRGIRGVVLAPPPGSDSRVEINLKDFAAIGLGLRIQEPFIERVSTDHYQAMRLTVRACREKGYRRPGLVVGETASERIGHRWEAAFLLEGWMAAGGENVPILTGPINEGPSATPRGFSKWLKVHRPDVVITTPSDRAVDWISAIQAISPRIGFASLGLRDRSGKIAGVWQNHPRLGAIAVELLAAKLQRNEHGAEHATDTHLVEGEWVDGLSLPEREERSKVARALPSQAESSANLKLIHDLEEHRHDQQTEAR